MILNLGCGSSKITGAINVDCEESVKPDMVFDLKGPFPLEDKTYDKCYLFHTIEHIEERYHPGLLAEIHRVLRDDGQVIISYPEFSKVAQNWLANVGGKREFWRNTIYGRQLYKSDYHISLMDSDNFKVILSEMGFRNIQFRPEHVETYNTIVWATKGMPLPTYEQVLYEDVFHPVAL